MLTELLETQLRQQARIAFNEGEGHALVMQGGNSMAIEIGTQHELQARLRYWLPVVGESKGEDVSLLIEALSALCVLTLVSVGLEVKVFTPEAVTEMPGGPNVE